MEAFRQNYTTNVEILKARLKAASQQHGQDIVTFLCDIRTLAGRAYRDHPHLLEQIVVTSFIEGPNNSTLRWNLRNLKPENADHALTKALELHAYLELEGRNPNGTASSGSAGVNHMTNQFLTENTAILSGRLKETPTTCRTIETKDHAIILVIENEIEITPWTGEAKMTHGTIQETDKEITHEIHETHTCLRAIDKTIAKVHARDMDKGTFLENVGRNNKIDQFVLSQLVMTGDKTAKIYTSIVEMHKTDHNHHTKADNMTLIVILDNEATIIQPGPKTKYARIAKELITLLENVKLVLIA